MTPEITTQQTAEIIAPADLPQLGQVANQVARAHVFTNYRERKSANTLRRQDADLAKFAEFIRSTGTEITDLSTPAAWTGVTWGLVEAFRNWLLRQGYAVGSVNVRLSTVKTYAKLAAKAGAISPAEYAMIATVDGYSHREQRRIDEQRQDAGIATRSGDKKSESVTFSARKAAQLKQIHVDPLEDGPQLRRDALLMCLLIDHGLRVSEVAGLTIGDVNLDAGEICFYRPKVDNRGCHSLTRDTAAAAAAYIHTDRSEAEKSDPLFVGSTKGGDLTGDAMSKRGINKRVRYLGEQVGIDGLSPHDCRHYSATRDAKNGKPIQFMMEKFGWTSPAMAIRYIEAAEVVEVD